jgi:hypothetical protein
MSPPDPVTVRRAPQATGDRPPAMPAQGKPLAIPNKDGWVAPAVRAGGNPRPALKSSALINQSSATRARLQACLAGAGTIVLKEPPERGDHVKAIQDALRRISSEAPLPDLPEIKDEKGVFGPSTATAVRKYQEIRAVKPAHGNIGPATLARIDSELAMLAMRKVVELPTVTIAAHDVEVGSVRDNLGKSDLAFDPVRLSDVPAGGLIPVVEMRQKSTHELETIVLDELRKADARFGPMLAHMFFANTTRPSADFAKVHPPGSEFSDFVAGTERFRGWSSDIVNRLDQQIKELGRAGPFDASKLAGRLPVELPHWYPRGFSETAAVGWSMATSYVPPAGDFTNDQAKMLALVGSMQGARVHVDDLVMDPQTRRYQAKVTFELTDHFGIDASDLTPDLNGHGTPGQVALFVLQHDRHADGHMPYRHTVQIRQTISGQF